MKVQFIPLAIGGKGWTRYGRGSAHFTDIDEVSAKLVVFGAIDDEKGDAGFAVEGTYDDTGWSSRTETVALKMSPSGEFAGQGAIPPQNYRFSGAVTDGTFTLDVHLEITEATANGLPAGTTFRFSYDLSRGPPEEENESAGGGKQASKDRTCRKIRYEMRPVANIGDGSMSMIRVPSASNRRAAPSRAATPRLSASCRKRGRFSVTGLKCARTDSSLCLCHIRVFDPLATLHQAGSPVSHAFNASSAHRSRRSSPDGGA